MRRSGALPGGGSAGRRRGCGARAECAPLPLAALLTLGAGLLALASPAAAEPPEGTPGAAGFEPSVHVGRGSYSGGLTFPGGDAWAPGRREASVGVHLVLAYRFGALLDAGLHVSHQWLAVEGLAAGSDAVSTANSAGVLVRAHPLTALWPRLPIDLALGVGFDFYAGARQTTETRDAVTAELTEARQAVPGFALPLWLELDVVLGSTALGLVASWAPWWRTEECAAVGTGLPECQARTGEPAQYLFLGAGLRQRLEFVE